MANDHSCDQQTDYAVAPGETLLETIEALAMTQVELAQRTGLSAKTVNLIIKGKQAITPDTALQLERVLGVSARLWMNLEAAYQEDRARLAGRAQLEDAAQAVDDFPYAEMARLGWVPATRKRQEKAEHLLRFFGVVSLGLVPEMYPAAYRVAKGRKPSPAALAAWCRKAELEAQAIRTEPYSRQQLETTLPELRRMTLLSPAEFVPQMRQLCARCGVAVALVPHLKKTYAHGATRWLSPTKALVQLSIRGRYADRFWFSFFHEIGHILLHGKRERFIEAEDMTKTKKEREADAFAADTLVPPATLQRLLSLKPSEQAVRRFAQEIQVHPCIIVGRLHHEGLLDFDRLKHLQPRLQWAEHVV